AQHSSQGRGIGPGRNAEAVAGRQNQFQQPEAVGSRWVGLHQRESNRTICSQPFLPVIERLIAEAVLATEPAHRQLALPLLPDQFLPFLLSCRSCGHSQPSHYLALRPSSARGG